MCICSVCVCVLVINPWRACAARVTVVGFFKVWMTIVESGWNVWVWLVGMVSKRWVWLVGVGGIYGCG